MIKINYPHLYEPIKLGNTVFRHRIFASPTGCLDLSHGGIPTNSAIAYYERKAIGGAAAVTIGDCIVDTKTGQITAYQVNMDNPLALPQMSAMAKAISRHGAVASVELQHGGMFSHYVYEQGRQLLGPVDILLPDDHRINNDGHLISRAEDGFRHVRAMTEEEILQLVEAFGKAAHFAKQCGFGMVMIHAAHGWGLAQFLSPQLNTRKDRWGGCLENRMRLTLAVIDCVRRYVGPGFPIEVRISGAECTPNGYSIDEGIRIAQLLDGKADLIHVSAGHHESVYASGITHPSMFLEDGCNVKFAAEVKRHVKTPVATVGALVEPRLMEEIIASGQADVIQMGRGLLADPDFPMKARMGMEDEIDTCMRCYACLSNSTRTRRRACAINPEIGNELEFRHDRTPEKKKRILVAGGGISGMAAAVTAAKRGHSVILCEKSEQLGGTLICEKNVPFKMRLHEYIARQVRRVYASGVDVRLSTEVDAHLAEMLEPDVIIAALGARPLIPNIPGIDGGNVFGAEEVYANPSLAGKNVVIIGGGLVGIELGIFLAGLGRSITIVEELPSLNHGGNMVHYNALSTQIENLQLRLELGKLVSEINEEGVSVISKKSAGSGDSIFISADTIIYAVGQKPQRDEASALRFCAPEFHQIGDCLTPKNIMEAVATANSVARDIGRL